VDLDSDVGLSSFVASVGRFAFEESTEILNIVDPFGINRAIVGAVGRAAGVPETLNVSNIVTPTEQTRMGLSSLVRGIVSVGSRLLSGAAPIARRVVASGAARGAAAGALVGGGVALATAGDGGAGVAPGIQQVLDAGGRATMLNNGRTMVTAPNGDLQIFSSTGRPIRPTLIIPAGQRLPGGATVVSTRNGGQLIGVTIRRARRKFAGEVNRLRTVIKAVKEIHALVKK